MPDYRSILIFSADVDPYANTEVLASVDLAVQVGRDNSGFFTVFTVLKDRYGNTGLQLSPDELAFLLPKSEVM